MGGLNAPDWVVLGDHFGLAVDAPGSRAARRAIEESFARAREGYADAALKVSASKEVKGRRGGDGHRGGALGPRRA
eukprot:3343391-Pyramimonas_sp.AAC.1